MQPALYRLAAACLLCLASAGAARAQARIEDCEKIQAADAYNQCLAKFGPTSKVKSVEPIKPGDIKDSGAEAAAGAEAKRVASGATKAGGRASRHAAHGHGVRGRARHGVAHASRHPKAGSGRKRMTIIVKHRK